MVLSEDYITFSIIVYSFAYCSYSTIYYIIGKDVLGVNNDMSRWELLTVLLSLKTLLESNNTEKALELINEVIIELKRQDR